jgi:hypothetical protein
VKRRNDAIRLLARAEDILRKQDLRLLAAAVLRRLGELEGGEGVGRIEIADAFMQSETIVRPDRMTAMILTVFDSLIALWFFASAPFGEESFDEMGSVAIMVTAVHKEDEAALQKALTDEAQAAIPNDRRSHAPWRRNKQDR